jgi:hypothetical protein
VKLYTSLHIRLRYSTARCNHCAAPPNSSTTGMQPRTLLFWLIYRVSGFKDVGTSSMTRGLLSGRTDAETFMAAQPCSLQQGRLRSECTAASLVQRGASRDVGLLETEHSQRAVMRMSMPARTQFPSFDYLLIFMAFLAALLGLVLLATGLDARERSSKESQKVHSPRSVVQTPRANDEFKVQTPRAYMDVKIPARSAVLGAHQLPYATTVPDAWIPERSPYRSASLEYTGTVPRHSSSLSPSLLHRSLSLPTNDAHMHYEPSSLSARVPRLDLPLRTAPEVARAPARLNLADCPAWATLGTHSSMDSETLPTSASLVPPSTLLPGSDPCAYPLTGQPIKPADATHWTSQLTPEFATPGEGNLNPETSPLAHERNASASPRDKGVFSPRDKGVLLLQDAVFSTSFQTYKAEKAVAKATTAAWEVSSRSGDLDNDVKSESVMLTSRSISRVEIGNEELLPSVQRLPELLQSVQRIPGPEVSWLPPGPASVGRDRHQGEVPEVCGKEEREDRQPIFDRQPVSDELLQPSTIGIDFAQPSTIGILVPRNLPQDLVQTPTASEKLDPEALSAVLEGENLPLLIPIGTSYSAAAQRYPSPRRAPVQPSTIQDLHQLPMGPPGSMPASTERLRTLTPQTPPAADVYSDATYTATIDVYSEATNSPPSPRAHHPVTFLTPRQPSVLTPPPQEASKSTPVNYISTQAPSGARLSLSKGSESLVLQWYPRDASSPPPTLPRKPPPSLPHSPMPSLPRSMQFENASPVHTRSLSPVPGSYRRMGSPAPVARAGNAQPGNPTPSFEPLPVVDQSRGVQPGPTLRPANNFSPLAKSASQAGFRGVDGIIQYFNLATPRHDASPTRYMRTGTQPANAARIG